MKSRIESIDDAVGASMTAAVAGAVRRVAFAAAVAFPMAILGVSDTIEGDSEAASAGELWLELQHRMNVATEKLR